MTSSVVVAIDGPSGSGKSSTARGAAKRLGLRYLDTGAQYRALTWWMLRAGVDVADQDAVAARCGEPTILSGTDPAAPTIEVDGVDVSAAIRTPEVTAAVSAVSAVPEVRRRIVAVQRDVIGDGGIVVEGRDIGSVVAPDAEVKIYLTAASDMRAQRRTAELGGASASLTEADLDRRDRADSTRIMSPLLQAADAVVVDTTRHTLGEVVDRVVQLVAAAPR